ncbi:hypothetical protein [Microbacterium lacusdiani]|jgi:hypothetical protein
MTYTKAAERRMNALRDSALDDARLRELLGLMLTGAIRRQMWLMFLDDDDRMSDLIMPMADYPEDADEPAVLDDLGPVTAAQAIGARIPMIAEVVGATQAVLVWERLGDEEFQPGELAWAARIAGALSGDPAGGPRVRLRGQFLLHDDGIRELTPDDYADAA